jgi:hypothetical protein
MHWSLVFGWEEDWNHMVHRNCPWSSKVPQLDLILCHKSHLLFLVKETFFTSPSYGVTWVCTLNYFPNLIVTFLFPYFSNFTVPFSSFLIFFLSFSLLVILTLLTHSQKERVSNLLPYPASSTVVFKTCLEVCFKIINKSTLYLSNPFSK